MSDYRDDENQYSPISFSLLVRLLGWLKPYWRVYALGAVCGVLSILLELVGPELLQLITGLPLGYRTVFNFYVMENYSHREIAEMLHCSENTSKTQQAKARQWLRKRIMELDKRNDYGKQTSSAR